MASNSDRVWWRLGGFRELGVSISLLGAGVALREFSASTCTQFELELKCVSHRIRIAFEWVSQVRSQRHWVCAGACCLSLLRIGHHFMPLIGAALGRSYEPHSHRAQKAPVFTRANLTALRGHPSLALRIGRIHPSFGPSLPTILAICPCSPSLSEAPRIGFPDTPQPFLPL